MLCFFAHWRRAPTAKFFQYAVHSALATLALTAGSPAQAELCAEPGQECLLSVGKAAALDFRDPAETVEALVKMASAAGQATAVDALLDTAERRLAEIESLPDLVGAALEIDRISRTAGLGQSVAPSAAFEAIRSRYADAKPRLYQTAISSLVDLAAYRAQFDPPAAERTDRLAMQILRVAEGEAWDIATAWMLFGKHAGVHGHDAAANEAFDRAAALVGGLPLREDGAYPRIAALLTLGQLSGEAGDLARASQALADARELADASDLETRKAIVLVIAHLLAREEREGAPQSDGNAQ